MIQGRKRKALEGLASGLSIERVASLSGASRVSIWRWKKEPEFQFELSGLQAELIQRISLRLLNITELALQALEDGLNSRDIKIRVKVAEVALSRAPSLAELGALNERIKKLENRKGA